MNTAICAAIKNRAVVEFYYNGGLRTVEPHCHGISTAGNEVLRGYQTGGTVARATRWTGNCLSWLRSPICDRPAPRFPQTVQTTTQTTGVCVRFTATYR